MPAHKIKKKEGKSKFLPTEEISSFPLEVKLLFNYPTAQQPEGYFFLAVFLAFLAGAFLAGAFLAGFLAIAFLLGLFAVLAFLGAAFFLAGAFAFLVAAMIVPPFLYIVFGEILNNYI